MNRGLLIASVIVAAAAATAAGSLEKWQAGTHYTLLARPQAPTVAKGKVEVNEIFWYGCAHCYKLDPTLETWNRGKASFIEFVRVPVIWGPVHRQHARLFYTLLALKRPDLHTVVFDTIHRSGNMLAAYSDEEARAQHRTFLKEHGVDEKAFDEAYDSIAVATNLAHAELVTRNFEVASVPLMIVNGKYQTSVSQAGSAEQLLVLVNDLAASEKRR